MTKTNAEAITESELAKHALSLSDAGRHAVLPYLAQNLQVRHDEQGELNVTVVAEDGSEVAPAAFFADWSSRFPGYFDSIKPTTKPATPEPRTMTERMVATIAARKADRKDEAAEIARAGNPWLPANRNMTRQAQITNLDPTLAGQMKQEAGFGHD